MTDITPISENAAIIMMFISFAAGALTGFVFGFKKGKNEEAKNYLQRDRMTSD